MGDNRGEVYLQNLLSKTAMHCQMYDICLVYMWYLSDRCLVGVD